MVIFHSYVKLPESTDHINPLGPLLGVCALCSCHKKWAKKREHMVNFSDQGGSCRREHDFINGHSLDDGGFQHVPTMYVFVFGAELTTLCIPVPHLKFWVTPNFWKWTISCYLWSPPIFLMLTSNFGKETSIKDCLLVTFQFLLASGSNVIFNVVRLFFS